MNAVDSLGRATFHHIRARRDIRPTERELRWLQHIERHGPQSSEFLFKLTSDTHRSKDTALRDLQKLRAGGFLRLPAQQRAIERAEFNPYIYDLTKLASDHLTGLGLSEATVRPTGHWWHAYCVAAFTGTLDICARRQRCEFIPAHTILGRNGAELKLPVGGRRLIPDQLFAVRYQEGFRAFLLEVDRSTEPFRSSAARKSLNRSVEQYVEVFARGLHRKHYGLKASTAVLWLFANPARLHTFQGIVRERAGSSASLFLHKTLPSKLVWREFEKMHRRPWLSGAGETVMGL